MGVGSGRGKSPESSRLTCLLTNALGAALMVLCAPQMAFNCNMRYYVRTEKVETSFLELLGARGKYREKQLESFQALKTYNYR